MSGHYFIREQCDVVLISMKAIEIPRKSLSNWTSIEKSWEIDRNRIYSNIDKYRMLSHAFTYCGLKRDSSRWPLMNPKNVENGQNMSEILSEYVRILFCIVLKCSTVILIQIFLTGLFKTLLVAAPVYFSCPALCLWDPHGKSAAASRMSGIMRSLMH